MAAAIAVMVGCSNIRRSGMSIPSFVRSSATIRTASIECPPSSKKLASASICPTPSAVAQTSAMSVSIGVRTGGPDAGAASASQSDSGSARRSTFPLVFNGISSTMMYAAGTM